MLLGAFLQGAVLWGLCGLAGVPFWIAKYSESSPHAIIGAVLIVPFAILLGPLFLLATVAGAGLKKCPYCYKAIHRKAVACPHCTRQVM